MLKLIDQISVFFPAYNEEGNIKNTIDKAVRILSKLANEWEILIVNDGSKDRTFEISETLSKKDTRIKVINHGSNKGYGASLKSGFYNSKYPWVAFTDSDGQFDFSDITEFIKKQKETNADLVIGYYLERKVPVLTILTSKLWELVVFILFGLKVKDIDCGFKLISREVIEKIAKLESEKGAFVSSELLIKAKKEGFKFAEVGVRHYPRKKGKSQGRKLDVIIKSFIDLFKLRLKLR